MIQSLRGMNDFLDEQENAKYSYFIQTASRIASHYGFTWIQTPILEETKLFKRSVGESSDIVGKEMYQFLDKGGNDVCMRPEGTAGVVRAFIQKKLDKAGGKHKFFYHGPMFRYERPQKGRLRQFHQFGCESFGIDHVLEDVTMILLIGEIFGALGIPFNLKINSLGCPNCMPAYRQTLVKFVTAQEAQICEDCNRRVGTNPIRVLDCKNASCQIIYKNAPKLIHELCSVCQNDFATLKRHLDQSGFSYEVDTHLVRGLDYYSKTAFEFIAQGIGAQNAIAGGGRYDRLVEFLDGKPTPAVGFAIGIERILDLITLPESVREGYYFGALQAEGISKLFELGQHKRASEKTTIEYEAKSLKNHLKAADKYFARYCVIIGEEELAASEVWVKDLTLKTESKIPWNSL